MDKKGLSFPLIVITFFFSGHAYGLQCETVFKSIDWPFYESLIADFEFRDSLPETLSSKVDWKPEWGRWGPWPVRFPEVKVPAQYDPVIWAQYRVEAVALKYVGIAYKHRHIPSLGGLDCSNFTAWVYNYGLGIKIVSNIEIQAQQAGRLLGKNESFQKGDLLFQWDRSGSRISHVVMYLGNNKVIDSSGGGVKVRPYEGWRRNNFAWARRIIE